MAFDFEALTDHVSIVNSYMAGNAGAGISYLSIYGGSDYNTNALAAGNTFVSNGNGSFRRAGGASTPQTGVIRDNLYSEPLNFIYQEGANYSGFTKTNNLSIPASMYTYYAGNQFGGTQNTGGSSCTALSNCWSYQYNNGSSWTNLSYYDSAAKVWQLSSTVNVPQIKQFEQHPTTCANCIVARAWTAPSTGTVSIRGRVLKSDTTGGDGIIARITKNGTRIWPVSGDQTVNYNDITGVEQVLDGVSVTAGDVIRFEVTNNANNNNSYDMTSWAPSIANTAVSGVAKSWGFDTNRDTESWTNANLISQSVSGGINTLTSSGLDPYIISADNLGITSASTYRYIKIRLKNNASDTAAQFFFTTTTSTGWDAAKSVIFTTTANASGYTEYVVDMGANANWTGTIKQLRFDPFSVIGTMNVDYIKITS